MQKAAAIFVYLQKFIGKKMTRLLKYIFVLLFAVACSNEDSVSPQLEQALYHFYTGQSYQRDHKYYEAMEEFLKAEQLSMDSDKVVLKGQICWHKGCMYAEKMNYSNALEMFSKALEFYSRSGSDAREYIMRTYEQMAYVYAENSNAQEAIQYYRKAIDMAMQMRAKMLFSPQDSLVAQKGDIFNTALIKYSTAIAAMYSKMEGGEALALAQLDSTYNKFNDSIANPADYPLLAKIYLQQGQWAKAAGSLAKYNSYKKGKGAAIESPDNLLEFYHVSAEVASRSGDYKEAAEYRGKYIRLKDSLDFETRRESVQEAEQQFWQRQMEEENHAIKMRNYTIAAIFLFLLICIGCAVAFVIVSYSRKLTDKNSQLAQYADAIDSLGTKVSSAERSRENLLSQLDVQKAKEKELKELLENRFSEVRELVRTYYEFGNSKKLQKKVDDLLKLQLSGDNFEVMEQVVNAKNNNVIKKVREVYPNMKEDNIKLLNLIYAGFTAQEISVILNDTPQNIYVRKSRLKKSIQDLISQDSQMNFS